MRSKSAVFNYGMAIVLFLASIAVAGCASMGPSPIKNISDAEMAIMVAKESNAAISAPLEIRAAEGKLQGAREAFTQKDYISAQRLADEALMTAKLAQVKSDTERIKNMVDQLRASIENLQEEINSTQKKD